MTVNGLVDDHLHARLGLVADDIAQTGEKGLGPHQIAGEIK